MAVVYRPVTLVASLEAGYRNLADYIGDGARGWTLIEGTIQAQGSGAGEAMILRIGDPSRPAQAEAGTRLVDVASYGWGPSGSVEAGLPIDRVWLRRDVAGEAIDAVLLGVLARPA